MTAVTRNAFRLATRLRRRRLVVVLGTLLSAAVAFVCHLRLDAVRPRGDAGARLLYLPNGEHLRALSLGFDELLADLIYLWSIQYYAQYSDLDTRHAYLEKVYFEVITELDPHYLDPYLLGSLILAWEARHPDRARALLEKGFAANPDEWVLLFEAGMHCYDEGDYACAASYYQRALDVPGAHPALRRLVADMYRRQGDLEAAYRSWRSIYESADSDFLRNVARNHVHDLTMELDVRRLVESVEQFRDDRGRLPRSLEELRDAGYVAAVPIDPDGRPYRYDPATGRVRGQSVYWLRRNQYPEASPEPSGGPEADAPEDEAPAAGAAPRALGAGSGAAPPGDRARVHRAATPSGGGRCSF